MTTAIRYGVDLMSGDGGYFLQPWIIAPFQIDVDRGDVAGPIPSLAEAEALQTGILERLKATVERSLDEAKMIVTSTSPVQYRRPGDEAKPFQGPEE